MTPEEMILSHDPEIVQLGISILKKDLSYLEIRDLVNQNGKFTLFGEHLYPRFSKTLFNAVIKDVFK